MNAGIALIVREIEGAALQGQRARLGIIWPVDVDPFRMLTTVAFLTGRNGNLDRFE